MMFGVAGADILKMGGGTLIFCNGIVLILLDQKLSEMITSTFLAGLQDRQLRNPWCHRLPSFIYSIVSDKTGLTAVYSDQIIVK